MSPAHGFRRVVLVKPSTACGRNSGMERYEASSIHAFNIAYTVYRLWVGQVLSMSMGSLTASWVLLTFQARISLWLHNRASRYDLIVQCKPRAQYFLPSVHLHAEHIRALCRSYRCNSEFPKPCRGKYHYLSPSGGVSGSSFSFCSQLTS